MCGPCAKGGLDCRRFDDRWGPTATGNAGSAGNTGNAGQLISLSHEALPLHIRRPMATPQLIGTVYIRDILHLLGPLSLQQYGAYVPHSDENSYSGAVFSRGGEVLAQARHLPSRMGHEPILDLAVECLALAIREISCRTQGMTPITYNPSSPDPMWKYGKALRGLQAALLEPQRARSAEILCATILLTIFEVGFCPEPQMADRGVRS